MRVTIQLPDDISAALQGQWDDVPRRALEAIAVEGYRTGALTESQVRRLLEIESRFQVHALLKAHHVHRAGICKHNGSSEFCRAKRHFLEWWRWTREAAYSVSVALAVRERHGATRARCDVDGSRSGSARRRANSWRTGVADQARAERGCAPHAALRMKTSRETASGAGILGRARRRPPRRRLGYEGVGEQLHNELHNRIGGGRIAQNVRKIDTVRWPRG